LNLEDLNDIPPWEWPEDTTAKVLAALRNRDAPEKYRLLAADLAGDMVILNEELGSALLSIAESSVESDDLRSMAAISLGPGLEDAATGDYDDPEDAPAFSEAFVQKVNSALHSLYSNPEVPTEVRRCVLEASVRNPQHWHAEAVRNSYSSNDRDWQLTSIFCMRYVPGFEDQILQALKSKDPDIHYNAVEAAGNWELDSAWPHIAHLVTSPGTEKSLRLAAISAAMVIRPHETEIIEPLVDSDDEDISEAAMDALTEAGFAADWDSEEQDEDYDPDDDQEDDDEEE